MTHVVDEFIKSQSLPLGHYARKHAKEAVRVEYSECMAAEDAFWAQYKGDRVIPFDNTITLANKLCDFLRVRRVRNVYETKEAYQYYDYMQRSIYLNVYVGRCCIRPLIHELAHHVAMAECRYSGHHGDFLWVEQMLFDVLLTMSDRFSIFT